MTRHEPLKQKTEAETTEDIAKNYGIGCLGQGAGGCLRGGCTGVLSLLLILVLLSIAVTKVL